MVSRQETARALLTPGEVMQLPPDDQIVLVSGLPPIRANKARYYEDRRLTARILPPPQLEHVERCPAPGVAVNPATKDDWTAPTASREEGGAADEDPANGGIRREPELREHEEIAPPEPGLASAPETFLPDETDDEEALKARLLRSQGRSLARQASMDPEDGIAL